MAQGIAMDLEEVWRIREEDIYPSLFGETRVGIYALTPALFERTFGPAEIDPCWLHYGVFEFAPTEARPSWLYVTSGPSTPCDDEPEAYDPEGQSGDGMEFLFASTVQGNWAIGLLLNMLAYDLLLSAGHFPHGGSIGPGHRIPLNSPIDGRTECVLRHVFVSQPDVLPAGFSLPSGRVDFLTFTGATDDEIGFARQRGTSALIDILREKRAYPATDSARRSAI